MVVVEMVVIMVDDVRGVLAMGGGCGNDIDGLSSWYLVAKIVQATCYI